MNKDFGWRGENNEGKNKLRGSNSNFAERKAAELYDSIEVNLTKRENCFELDEDYLDSTLSDLIIQYAVFGELVYA